MKACATKMLGITVDYMQLILPCGSWDDNLQGQMPVVHDEHR